MTTASGLIANPRTAPPSSARGARTPPAAPAVPASRMRGYGPSLVHLALLLPLVAVVHAVGIADNPARFEDEGTYVAQAWAIHELGELAHYTYWYDHPPFGWMQISLWTWLTSAFERSSSSVAAGRELMLVVNLVSSSLIFAIARRVGMRRGFASLAVLLFALCPLSVYFHRMALLDNIAVMWLLAAFALALTPHRRLWAFAAAGICFALAVLTKETTLVLLPVLALAVWQGSDRHTRAFCAALFGAAVIIVGSLYLLYAVLKGELLPGADHVSLWEGIEFQLFSRAPSGSVFDPSSNAREVIDGWMAVDAWLMAGGALLTPIALLDRRLRVVALALGLQLAMMLRPGYLPFPYVIALLPFAALVVAGAADRVWRWRPLYARPRGSGTVSGVPPARARRAARLRRAGPAAAAVSLAVAALMVGGAWYRGDRALMTERPDAPFARAVDWLQAKLSPERDVILVDSSLWLDLVRGGFDSGVESDGRLQNVVWFYKLERDPEVRAQFPEGHRSIDYVVSTPIMRASLSTEPATARAVERSELLVTFGRGEQRIEIRAMHTAATQEGPRA